jgi:copper chaperone CopZ
MATFIGAVMFVLAAVQDPGPAKEDLRPLTLHIAGIACPSCAGPVRSALSRLAGVREVEVSVEEKFVRLKFDEKKTSIQSLMQAALGEDDRFPSRLVLKLENPKAEAQVIEKARLAVAEVPGVRAMSLPDREGIVLVTFHLDRVTRLSDLLKAAKDAGLPLGEPPPQKPSH